MTRAFRVACGCLLLASAHAGLKDSASFRVGVAVVASDNEVYGTHYAAQVKTDFSEITEGDLMKMKYLHPSEDTYTWATADRLATWASENGIRLHGHTLLWHSDYQVPSFMNNYDGDFEAMLKEHCKTIADHFSGGRVASWDVANEVLNDGGACYRDSVFYQKLGKSYVPLCFTAARAGDPTAKLYYNDYNIEHSSSKFTCLKQLIKDVQDAGAPIDGIGFQCHIQLSTSVSTMKSHFKQIADLGLLVKITELDIANPNNDNAMQKSKYKEVVEAYLEAVPLAQRGGISVWGLHDAGSWLGGDEHPLLFSGTGPFVKKQAYDGFEDGLRSGLCAVAIAQHQPCREDPYCCDTGMDCYAMNSGYAQCRVDCTLDGWTCENLSPSTPAPTPAPPPTISCTATIAQFQPCRENPFCCGTGLSCYSMNFGYAQCRADCFVAGWTCVNLSPPTPAPTPAPTSECSTTIGQYQACKENPNCCDTGMECYEMNSGYAQCRIDCFLADWTCVNLSN